MLTLAFAASIFAQTIPPPADIQQRVDGVFRYDDKPGSSAGCVLGIAQNGVIVHWRGYGYEANPPPRPLDLDTVFEIGPFATTMMSWALEELRREGRLSFDENVRERITELPEYEVAIRIRDLLDGRSRLRSYRELFALALHDPNVQQDDARILKMIVRQKGLQADTSFLGRMSDTEQFLLSTIVESTIGISIAQLIRERIFIPLKMDASSVGDPLDSPQKRQTIYTTLRDLGKWMGSKHQDLGVRPNAKAPGLYRFQSGVLIALCNNTLTDASDLVQRAGSVIFPQRPATESMPGIMGGVPIPAPTPPPGNPGPVSGRFHSQELDMDIVLDHGALKLVRPDGSLVTYCGPWDSAPWASASIRFVQADKQVNAIVVGSGYSIRDIRFDKVP
jgi:CubicO group peptidase (beta-lactamase class C family)